MKDCYFQYATTRKIVEDTGLITRADAEEMWQKHIEMFKKDVEAGETPEMAIWINMENDTAFHTTASHWCGDEMVIENGTMYMKKAVA